MQHDLAPRPRKAHTSQNGHTAASQCATHRAELSARRTSTPIAGTMVPPKVLLRSPKFSQLARFVLGVNPGSLANLTRCLHVFLEEPEAFQVIWIKERLNFFICRSVPSHSVRLERRGRCPSSAIALWRARKRFLPNDYNVAIGIATIAQIDDCSISASYSLRVLGFTDFRYLFFAKSFWEIWW